jgi:hypothetical protein
VRHRAATRRLLGAALLALLPCSLAACSHLVAHSNAGIASLEAEPGSVGAIARGAKYSGWAVSAPLVAVTTPVAALAWATPWVDLVVAVDIASAPAIGLGYLFEALVGFPVKGLRWLVGKARDPEPAPATAGRPFVPWGFVVEHLEASPVPRPADTLPRELADHYAVDQEALAAVRGALWRQILEAKPDESPLRVPLPPSSFEATLELYRAPGASPSSPRPLVLLTPPTEAAFAGRYLAARFARRGIHGAVVVPEKPFLEKHLAPADVEARLRDAVVAARTALRALEGLPAIDTGQVHYLGVSAGAIFGGVLLAVEPAIGRAVLILTGGDLPRIVAESEESSVKAYRAAWKARGVDAEPLRRELARDVRTDPQRLARFVEPRRVLLFLGASDTVVPVATGLELRAALGDPETYLLGGNHDSASVCFGFILRRSEQFLLEGR